ncbi:MAG: diiron oxygenase [Planctomycetes bacterium]|nr:diiron oxygenase [Planctomycetota bacterium]
MKTPVAFANRLSEATVRKHYHPIRDVDWSAEIDLDHFYVCERFISIHGTETYERMSPAERRLLSLYESVSKFSTGIWLENVLMYGFLDHLYSMDYADPDCRYMLHEVADEANHSIMFHQYVRHAGLGYVPVSPVARWVGELFRRRVARLNPYLFMIGVLAGEEPPDYFSRGIAGDEAVHPLARRISEIHAFEEGRHIAYAKEFLKRHFAEAPAWRRVHARIFAPLTVQIIVGQFFYPRWPVGMQAAPDHLRFAPETRVAIDAARRRQWRARNPMVRDSVRRLTTFLEEIGAISPRSRWIWRNLGLIET